MVRRKKAVCVTIPIELEKWLRREAVRINSTISFIVERALERCREDPQCLPSAER